MLIGISRLMDELISSDHRSREESRVIHWYQLTHSTWYHPLDQVTTVKMYQYYTLCDFPSKLFGFIVIFITKTCLFKYIENLTSKNWIFSDRNADTCIVLYFCSKHRLWYSLEPPRRGGSNEYPRFMFLSRNKKKNVYPCKPKFYTI